MGQAERTSAEGAISPLPVAVTKARIVVGAVTMTRARIWTFCVCTSRKGQCENSFMHGEGTSEMKRKHLLAFYRTNQFRCVGVRVVVKLAFFRKGGSQLL